MQRAKVHRKYGRYVISVAFAPPRNIEMFDNRSWLIFDSDRTYSFVSHSHRSSTPFSHLLSLPFLPLRSFHFLLSFFLPPSSSFWPKTDSGHGSSTTAGRPFCMPRVPCHTRQQARKSNFHRETYYTRRLVHIHDRVSSKAYHRRLGTGGIIAWPPIREREREREEEETRVVSGNFAAIVIGDWQKAPHTSFYYSYDFVRDKKYLYCWSTIVVLLSVRIDARLNREFGRKYPMDISSSSMPTFAPFHE